jgi:hypothetical protein
MKALFFSSIFFLSLCGSAVQADDGNPAYRSAMTGYLGQMQTAATPEDWQALANGFQRIAQAEPDEWLPLYYAALVFVEWQHQETSPDKKDQLLQQGRELADRAAQIQPGHPEILALQGYIAMMRLSIDPATRAQEMAPTAMGLLQQAVQTDPGNPRARMLLAQMKFGTAAFFGAGTEEPCEEFGESIRLFDAAVPAEELMPSWGREMAEYFAGQCP